MVKIGITSTAGRPGEPYLRAVERAGGEPVMLANAPHEIDAQLAALDGVLLSGGVDVDVARYGGRPGHSRSEREFYRTDRDDFELALARATRARDVPTLCICRGLQVANVAFGGTLVEDVRDELGARYTIEHRQTDENGVDRSAYAPDHTVTVTPGSALAGLVGRTAFETNSMHHQAVRAVGTGLVAVGRTSDGVIEALEATFPHRFFFAVQWHPEASDDRVSAALFGGLVAAAAAAR
ncbi:MAG: gamma-glutamyl-gamma-aminobutyrate hydrolase family protein [Vulcanimicrobiaceae bacterium]